VRSRYRNAGRKRGYAAASVSEGRPRRIRTFTIPILGHYAALAQFGQTYDRASAGNVHIWWMDVCRCDGSNRRVRCAKFLPALMQYFSIPWDIPLRKAKEAMFRSRFIGAEEAFRLGFVNHVVPRERLEAETMELAQEIAENDPFTLRMVKWATNSAQDA